MPKNDSAPGLSGREKAYNYVKDQVLTSLPATGTFLNEQELASSIGVSRTPVREALLMLRAEAWSRWCPSAARTCPPCRAARSPS
ncbi:GntR family transcriptional regulator [Nocardia thraciensis]